MRQVELSIIVAVYNEEEVLQELHRRLTNALIQIGRSYEILLVDDGSRDRSLEIMLGLRSVDPEHVRVFSFTRNFGHHIALTAGLDHAVGDVVVMMDADLQDQPEELHKLLDKLDEGYDVVWGDREERQFKWYKNVTSKVFLWTMNSVVRAQVPLNSSIYRAMRREVADDLRKMREKARYLPGLVSWLGYRQTSTPVIHGKRFAGQTKYSVYRLLKLALSTATSFSAAPLQLATLVGMGTAVIAIIVLIYIFVRKLLGGYHVLGYASVMFAILFFGALQLIVIGLMGEYISRIYSESQARPLYLLKDLDVPRLRVTSPRPAIQRTLSQLPSEELLQIEAILKQDKQLPMTRVFSNASQGTVAAMELSRWREIDPTVFLHKNRDQVTAVAVLQSLDWDTRMLGIESARLTYANAVGATDVERADSLRHVLQQLRSFAHAQSIRFIDARVPNQDLFMMRAFEAEDFHTVDMLVTLGADKAKMQRVLSNVNLAYDRGVWSFSNSLCVRQMRPEEEAELAQLSYDAFGEHEMIQDRFFLEPEIPHDRAQELFREWFKNLAKKQYEGKGIVLVAEVNGKVSGYVALERMSPVDGLTYWKDTLNAVGPAARGQGAYKALIRASIDYVNRNGGDGIITKTQSSTYRVINTWLHLGCDLYESFTTLHYFDRADA